MQCIRLVLSSVNKFRYVLLLIVIHLPSSESSRSRVQVSMVQLFLFTA